MSLFEPLRAAIVRICEVDPAQVRPDTLLDDLGIDSLAAAEILVELEIHLDRELPLQMLRTLDDVRTVGDIAGELERALAPTT